MSNAEKRRLVIEFINNPVWTLGIKYNSHMTKAINNKYGTTLSESFVQRVRDSEEDRILAEQAQAQAEAVDDDEKADVIISDTSSKPQPEAKQPFLFPEDIEADLDEMFPPHVEPQVKPRFAEGTHKDGAGFKAEVIDEPVGEPVDEPTMDSGTDLAILASGWVRDQDNGKRMPVDIDQIWGRAGYTLRKNAIRAFEQAVRNFRLVEGTDYFSLKRNNVVTRYGKETSGKPTQAFIMTVGAAKRFMAAAQTPEGFGCIDILITEEEKYAELKAAIARGEYTKTEQPKQSSIGYDPIIMAGVKTDELKAVYALGSQALDLVKACNPSVSESSYGYQKLRIAAQALERMDILDEYKDMFGTPTSNDPPKYQPYEIAQEFFRGVSAQQINKWLHEIGLLDGRPGKWVISKRGESFGNCHIGPAQNGEQVPKYYWNQAAVDMLIAYRKAS
jgi:hypothetical protein